jgi:hypothetical protein
MSKEIPRFSTWLETHGADFKVFRGPAPEPVTGL